MKIGDLVKVHERGKTFVGLITQMIERSAHGPSFNRWAVLYNGQEWNCIALHLEVIKNETR